jgi:hypothetical protein
VPDLPKIDTDPLTFAQEGFAAGLGSSTLAAGNKAIFPKDSYADLTGAKGGVTVTIRQMAQQWPAALEVTGGGDVTAGLFTHRNVGVFTFCWRQHESRTAVFNFHLGAGDPKQAARRAETPVVGRLAQYLIYDVAGVFPTDLVTVQEQDAIYALLGFSHKTSVGNEEAVVTRYMPSHLTGGENNHDYVERLLVGEFLRFGSGGQWLNAMDRALYFAEWQILRSDNFLHKDDPGAINDDIPHSTNFPGDEEHRYRDGLVIAYWLSGDARFRDALLDEAEILPSIKPWAHERSAYQTIRALCAVAEFAHAEKAMDPALHAWLSLFNPPLIDVDTDTTGFGWETTPGNGDRGYYVFSQQNNSEKNAGEFFVTRGFVTACLGPMAMYRAARHLPASDPDGASARGRLRDLATYTRGELFPYFKDPASRRLVYSYGVKTMTVNSWDTTDFHTILLGMAEAWRQTGDLTYLVRGIQQIEAFQAHGKLSWMDRRVECQHFYRALLDALKQYGL